MEAAVECTHCRVVMTSWSAAGSLIRYYQCPFCTRTHSSHYGEVFRSQAGARVLDAPVRPAAPGLPSASAEDVRWARVRATAAKWFARLEAEDQRTPAPRALPSADDVPELDPADVVEVTPAPRRARRR